MKNSKKQIVSILLLLAMFMQILPMSVFAAKSSSSIEVVVLDDKGGPVNGGRVRVMDDRGRQLSFTTKNGLYEYDSAGFYNEGKTQSNGSLIFTGLEVGNYKIEHLSNAGEVLASYQVAIVNLADFEEVVFKLPKVDAEKPEEGGNTNSEKPSTNNTVEKKGLVFSFNSSGVNYRLKSNNGKTVMLTQLDAGNYQAGGGQASFKSNRNISIHGLKPGNYMLEGEGVRYKIKYNGTYNGYKIDDKETNIPAPEGVSGGGKIVLNLKDKRTGAFYQGGRFTLVDAQNKKIGLIQEGNKYNYSAEVNDNIFIVNGESVEINGLPNGTYRIIDTTSNEDPKIEETKVDIVNNGTETLNLEKGIIKNSATITVIDEDESIVDGYIFNLLNEEGKVLNFIKNETVKDAHTVVEYVYTDQEEIEGKEITDELKADSDKNIKLKDIPYNKVIIEELEVNKKYEPKEKETIALSYKEDTKYDYLVEQKKFVFNLKDSDEDVVGGVEVIVKEADAKESDEPVFIGESDEKGVLEIKGLDTEKDYVLIATKVPSPYALPFDGEAYNISLNDTEELDGDIEVPFANFIAKTSSEMEGSIFSFVNENGEEVYRLTSDEQGFIGVDRIEHGKYVVSQITAAEGYKVDREKFELIVGEDYINPDEDDHHVFLNPKIGAESDTDEEEVKEPSGNIKKVIIFTICLIVLLFIYFTLVNLDYKDKHGENKYAFFTKLEKAFGKKPEELDEVESSEDDKEDKKETNKKDKK